MSAMSWSSEHLSARLGAPLTPEDAARLHMGIPENPMVIMVALVLDRMVDIEDLRVLLGERLGPHHWFRDRVVESKWGFGLPRWVRDASFDLRHHVRSTRVGRSTLPNGEKSEPPSSADLEALLGTLASTPLDVARPLWTIDLIEGMPDGSVIVLRVNHALADGLALVSVLLDICDEGGHTEGPPAPASPATGSRLSAGGRLRRVLAGVASATRLAFRRAEPSTPLRGKLGVQKWAAVSRTFSVEEVSSAGHALDVTLTALVVSAAAGAIRDCVSASMPIDGLTLHVLLPVSVRLGTSDGEGNAYGSVFVPLPLDLGDPRRRAREVHATLKLLRGAAAESGGLLAGAAGALTATVERLGVAFFSRRASAVVSSIRGPTSLLHVGGATVRDVLAWAPCAGSIGLAMTVLSYGDTLRIGMLADAGLRPVAETLLAAIEGEIEALLATSSPPAR